MQAWGCVTKGKKRVQNLKKCHKSDRTQNMTTPCDYTAERLPTFTPCKLYHAAVTHVHPMRLYRGAVTHVHPMRLYRRAVPSNEPGVVLPK